jgi:uracil-DNA glycosylase family 4
VGLAPAAHGANRTGRMFTGDESGGFLFSALHAVGMASQAESRSRGDGLRLHGVLISAAARCAPPGNRPTRRELENCSGYLREDYESLPAPRVLVALGGVAFDACLRLLAESGAHFPRPRPRFSHGARVEVGPDVLFGSYHPSPQNTYTKKLTQGMLRGIFRRAQRAARDAGRR